jgi:hypothetical protein
MTSPLAQINIPEKLKNNGENISIDVLVYSNKSP